MITKYKREELINIYLGGEIVNREDMYKKIHSEINKDSMELLDEAKKILSLLEDFRHREIDVRNKIFDIVKEFTKTDDPADYCYEKDDDPFEYYVEMDLSWSYAIGFNDNCCSEDVDLIYTLTDVIDDMVE